MEAKAFLIVHVFEGNVKNETMQKINITYTAYSTKPRHGNNIDVKDINKKRRLIKHIMSAYSGNIGEPPGNGPRRMSLGV